MRTIRLLTVTIAALALLGGIGASAAGAQDPRYPLPDESGQVLPDTQTNVPPAPSVEGDVTPLAQSPAVQSGVGGLPVTGGDLVGLTLIGAAAVGMGIVLVRTRRTAS